jgi:hypothetical protein
MPPYGRIRKGLPSGLSATALASPASKQAGHKQPEAFSGIGRNGRAVHQQSGPDRHGNGAPQAMHLALRSSDICIHASRLPGPS